MFPNSPNISIELLTLDTVQNSIGVSTYRLISKKTVIGISFSISQREYYESKRKDMKIDIALKIQSFLYNGSKYVNILDKIYKVERTYQAGQFMELYLSETKIRKSDIVDYN